MKILLLSTNSDEAGAPRHVEFLFNQPKEPRPAYRLKKITKKQYKEMGIV